MYFYKIKSIWKLKICFCDFCKKFCFSFSTWSILNPFFCKLGQKTAIFRGFTKLLDEAPVSICLFFCPSNGLSVFRAVRGIKVQKTVQDEQYILHPSNGISKDQYSIWSWFLVKMISPGVFFFFFKTLIFWVVRGIKGQKMAQNDKKFCLSCFISQEQYMYDFNLWYTCVKKW